MLLLIILTSFNCFICNKWRNICYFFTSVIEVSVGIARASFSLVFSLSTGIIKNLLKITRNKKKKHNKIVMLAKIKLNSIEKLVSQALINFEISHEE